MNIIFYFPSKAASWGRLVCSNIEIHEVLLVLYIVRELCHYLICKWLVQVVVHAMDSADDYLSSYE